MAEFHNYNNTAYNVDAHINTFGGNPTIEKSTQLSEGLYDSTQALTDFKEKTRLLAIRKEYENSKNNPQTVLMSNQSAIPDSFQIAQEPLCIDFFGIGFCSGDSQQNPQENNDFFAISDLPSIDINQPYNPANQSVFNSYRQVCRDAKGPIMGRDPSIVLTGVDFYNGTVGCSSNGQPGINITTAGPEFGSTTGNSQYTAPLNLYCTRSHTGSPTLNYNYHQRNIQYSNGQCVAQRR